MKPKHAGLVIATAAVLSGLAAATVYAAPITHPVPSDSPQIPTVPSTGGVGLPSNPGLPTRTLPPPTSGSATPPTLVPAGPSAPAVATTTGKPRARTQDGGLPDIALQP